MMKTIETTEQLITWAKEVNNGVSLSRKCDLQDIIGHSNKETLKKLFIAANGSRNLITCSFYNTMSYDFVEEMLLALAKHKAQALIDKESERLETEWTKREERLEDGKKAIYKKIATLKNNIDKLESKLEREKAENAVLRKKKMELSDEVKRLSVDAERFNIIKKLLSSPAAVEVQL